MGKTYKDREEFRGKKGNSKKPIKRRHSEDSENDEHFSWQKVVKECDKEDEKPN
jgi:hypothetical protein